jgi:hypothetical protein
MKDIYIQAQTDYLDKISKATPVDALAEMIWNALDADATTIRIKFLGTEISTDEIEITDNGTGINYELAIKTFGELGGSWKRQKGYTNQGRGMHGKEGHGRFKAFSIGSSVIWKVYYKKDKEYFEYSIEGHAGDLDKFKISDESKSKYKKTGVVVRITDPVKQFKVFEESIAVNTLIPIFAPYLSSYVDVNITIGNNRLDPKQKIKSSKEIELKSKINEAGNDYNFIFELYEWDNLAVKELYFCDNNGFPLHKYDKQIRGTNDFSYSGYIKSDYFSDLKSTNEIEVCEIKNELQPVIRESLRALKDYFIDIYRLSQKNIIDQWKREDVYPYSDNESKTEIEIIQEKVFDILALNLNEYVDDFNESSNKQKKLQFKLLQQALETNPNNINKIMTEVINLPPQKSEELASLLEYTSLSSIISTSKIITDRLKFIFGFEEIVFDVELKKAIKERSRLHKILSDNAWFFGDEYFVSVNDQSLTEVLKKHISHLDKDIILDIDIESPVLRLDGKIGIVDLMLSKAVPKNHNDEVESLIVELKAPRVKIGQAELGQIERYAFAVSADERFRGLKSRWEFWIISNDMDEHARRRANQQNYNKGTIFQSNENNIMITIKVKTWSEIIAENKHRYNFVKTHLDLSISNADGLRYLQEKYSNYLGENKHDVNNEDGEKNEIQS